MDLSLSAATFIPGCLLLVFGALFLLNNDFVEAGAKRSLRSAPLSFLFFGAGAAWFIYHLNHLGEADFGQYKNYLMAFFGVIGVSAWFVMPDFLGVRGVAILVLLFAHELLMAAFMEDYGTRLFMVGFVYVCIVLALYFGAMPYRLRDFFDWLFAEKKRPRVLGGVFTAYGMLLCIIALTY